MLRVATLMILVLVGWSSTATAGRGGKAKAPPRVYLELGEVTAAAALGKRGPRLVRLAGDELPGVLADHPRVVIAGDADAPDVTGDDAAAVAAALKRAKLAGAYAVRLVVLACKEQVADDRLAMTIEVDLVGVRLPGDQLTFSARAAATVSVEVAEGVTAADRQRAIRSALRVAATDALSRGIEEVAPARRGRPTSRGKR